MTWERPPRGAEDWSGRYRDQDTPWDVGGPHPELARRLRIRDLAPARAGATALVPGAGFAHDALALAEAGFEVTALDFATGVRTEVAQRLEDLGGHFVEADALEFQGGPFDLVFDHTFFCALDPGDRPRWGSMIDRVLGPDGQLVAIVFPSGKPRDGGGPPHAMEVEDVTAALAGAFELDHVEPVMEPLQRREWTEWWARFTRTRTT